MLSHIQKPQCDSALPVENARGQEQSCAPVVSSVSSVPGASTYLNMRCRQVNAEQAAWLEVAAPHSMKFCSFQLCCSVCSHQRGEWQQPASCLLWMWDGLGSAARNEMLWHKSAVYQGENELLCPTPSRQRPGCGTFPLGLSPRFVSCLRFLVIMQKHLVSYSE